MTRRWSRLPLLLVLAVAVGSGILWQGSVRSTGELKSPLAATNAEIGSSGYGPIPLASAVDEDAAVPRREAAAVTGDMQALAAKMSRETKDLSVVTHPDGRRSVSLEGRFLHMSAVVTGADGKPQVRCFTDFHEMAAALPGGGPIAPPRPEIDVR